MTYTIEQLEKLKLNVEKQMEDTDFTQNPSPIRALEVGHLLSALDQLLATLRENAALQAKIDAALAIESSGDKPAYAWEGGWDACRDEFRATLGEDDK